MFEQGRVQRQFSAAAQRYDQKTAMQREIIDAQLSKIMGKPKSVIDLGCGTGYAISQLTSLGVEQLCGVDLAPGMLAFARQRVPQATFLCANLEALPLADASVELVLSASAVQWCNLARSMSEAARVVRDEGQIIISTFSSGTLAEWRTLWGFKDRERFWSASHLRREAALAGLHVTEVSTHAYKQRFADFNSAVDSIREIGAGEPASSGLGGRARYKSACDQVSAIIAQQGAITLRYCVTTICAIKLRSPSSGSLESIHRTEGSQKRHV